MSGGDRHSERTATCPVCERADHKLTYPANRFRLHDRGFLGRKRGSIWRDDVCPASGHTVEEASVLAHRIRVGAVGAP